MPFLSRNQPTVLKVKTPKRSQCTDPSQSHPPDLIFLNHWLLSEGMETLCAHFLMPVYTRIIDTVTQLKRSQNSDLYENLFNVNYKSFNKICSLVAEIRKFKNWTLKTSVSNVNAHCRRVLYVPAGKCTCSPTLRDGAVFISKRQILSYHSCGHPISHQDMRRRRRPFWAAVSRRMASLLSGHHRPSSETVTACLWPLWIQTVELVCSSVSVSSGRSRF